MKKILAALVVLFFSLGSNGQIKVKQISERELGQGFFAPKDWSISLGYDHEKYRLGYSDGSNPYSLDGIRAGFAIRSKLFSIISLEIPLYYRMGWMKDSNPSGGFDYLKKHEIGLQTGLLLSTGYRFKNTIYFTFSCGPKIDATISDEQTTENSERKLTIDYVDGHFEKTINGNTTEGISDNHKQTKTFDIPICFSANFRYKWVGVYFNYDIGMIDRQTDTYYEYTGVSKEHTLKTNHMSIGLQLFIPLGKLNK